MAIPPDVLLQLASAAHLACTSGENILTSVRPQFPGITMTQCPSSDVVEPAYLEGEDFNLHLIDTRNHCWQITAQPEAATAVLWAMHRTPS